MIKDNKAKERGSNTPSTESDFSEVIVGDTLELIKNLVVKD